eukprot:gene4078-4325_t
MLRRGSTGTDTPAALPGQAAVLDLVRGLQEAGGSQRGQPDADNANDVAHPPGAAAAAQLGGVTPVDSCSGANASAAADATDDAAVDCILFDLLEDVAEAAGEGSGLPSGALLAAPAASSVGGALMTDAASKQFNPWGMTLIDPGAVVAPSNPQQAGPPAADAHAAELVQPAAATDSAVRPGSASGVEPGSDGDDFDPSMLPADLFDFLDASGSPRRQAQQQEPEDPGGGTSTDWGSSHEQPQHKLNESEPNSDGHTKAGKYIPPSLRSGSVGHAAAAAPGSGAASSSDGGGGEFSSHRPSALERSSSSAAHNGPSPGTYQPPHARNRDPCGGSPPGFSAGHRANSTWPLAPTTSAEQEERILAQQQQLPRHLPIVPQDHQGPPSSTDEREWDGRDSSHWPPPPPPHAWTDHDTPSTTGGSEAGRSNIRRFFEQAAAAVPPPPPPPPPPAPPARAVTAEPAALEAAADLYHGNSRGGPGSDIYEGYDRPMGSSRHHLHRTRTLPPMNDPSAAAAWEADGRIQQPAAPPRPHAAYDSHAGFRERADWGRRRAYNDHEQHYQNGTPRGGWPEQGMDPDDYQPWEQRADRAGSLQDWDRSSHTAATSGFGRGTGGPAGRGGRSCAAAGHVAAGPVDAGVGFASRRPQRHPDWEGSEPWQGREYELGPQAGWREGAGPEQTLPRQHSKRRSYSPPGRRYSEDLYDDEQQDWYDDEHGSAMPYAAVGRCSGQRPVNAHGSAAAGVLHGPGFSGRLGPRHADLDEVEGYGYDDTREPTAPNYGRTAGARGRQGHSAAHDGYHESGRAWPTREGPRSDQWGAVADSSLTWQQQELLEDEEETVAGVAVAALKGVGRDRRSSSRAVGGDELPAVDSRPYRTEHIPVARVDRDKERRGSRLEGPGPATAVEFEGPQPSQFLRAAAHGRGRGPAASAADEGSSWGSIEARRAADPRQKVRAASSGHSADEHRLSRQQHEPEWCPQEEQEDISRQNWSAAGADFLAAADAVAAGEVGAGVGREAAASAAAAAMAAVQGLKPICSAMPSKATKGSKALVRHNSLSSPAAGKTAGCPQLPSIEVTEAAVLAALGPGPSGPPPARTTSAGSQCSQTGISSLSDFHQHESGAFWRAESGDIHSREASSGSVGSSAVAAAADVPAGGGARRVGGSGGSLFSSVIGQLRRQAGGPSGGGRPEDGDQSEAAYGSSPADYDQSPRTVAGRGHIFNLTPHTAGSQSTAQQSSGSTAGAAGAGGSSRCGADAADLVLAAIQTTRQHAHVHLQRSAKAANSNRVKQVACEGGRAGKADAAWREAAPDTAPSWDDSGSSEQPL